MLDVATLLMPLEGDPAGPDLSYDEGRRLIEEAFDRRGEAEVDWAEVVRLAQDQAVRTRDLWVAIFLARAGAQAGRLDLVADGAELLAGLLEAHWDDVHPRLEDEDDPSRKLACDSLARHGEFVGPLQRLVLVEHPRLGSFTAADLDRFERGGEAEEGYGLFRAALEQVDADALAGSLATLDRARDAFRRADAALDARSGVGGTDFDPVFGALARIRALLAAHVAGGGEMVEVVLAPDAVAAAASPVASTPAGGGAPGRIESREDVIRALDAIADYYRRREPASPVPVALQRARAWVPMGFMEVLADIAPDSVGEAQRVLMNRLMISEAEGG